MAFPSKCWIIPIGYSWDKVKVKVKMGRKGSALYTVLWNYFIVRVTVWLELPTPI